MPKTIAYTRVSTLTQVSAGDGLDAQRSRIDAWCAYQGLALDAVHEDAGISGSEMQNRPGFLAAIRDVLESGRGSTLVVYKIDRLGRSAVDIQETLAVLLDSGVRVVSISDGVDSHSGMGAALLKLLTSILATFAELEKETIVSRLQGGRQHAKAKGKVYSREPAYGATNGADGMLRDVPEESKAAERARELSQQGLSLRQVGARLLLEGLKPRHSEKWAVMVVARFIRGREVSKPKASQRVQRARAQFLGMQE